MTKIMILVVAMLGLAVPAHAFNEAQKKEIGEVVRQYLLDNPSLIYEAADRHQANMMREAEARGKKVLVEHAKDLFASNEHPIIGNAKARVGVVEFFDYNCGYCKQAFGELTTATAANQDLKIILIDTPILGPSSQLAAQWSIAAHQMGKGLAFHTELMNFQGPKDETTLSELATKAGLDPAKVKAAAAGEAVSAQLAKNMELFQKLGLNGTPAFAAPDRVIRGAISGPMLDQIVKEHLDKNPTVKK